MQKEISLGVAHRLTPILDLNHCRFSSTKLMIAIGTRQMYEAKAVSSSKLSSGGVSRISSERKASSRSTSLSGTRIVIVQSFLATFCL